MKDAFVIEPLGGHDRSAFACGAPPLDRYLREQASQDVKRLMASCFVALAVATNSIAGYYTLAATSVPDDDLPPDVIKRLPRYPLLPAALIGRLAVDQRFHGAGAPDSLRDEEVMACVIVSPGTVRDETTARALQVWCLERLAYYKAPGYVAFVDALPVTSTNKVQKTQLAAFGADPLNAPECFDLRSFKKRVS